MATIHTAVIWARHASSIRVTGLPFAFSELSGCALFVPQPLQLQLVIELARRRLRRKACFSKGVRCLGGLARQRLNRLAVPVKQAVRDVGVTIVVGFQAPLNAGGWRGDIDIFEQMLIAPMGLDVISLALEAADRALGAYEALVSDPELLSFTQRDGIDIVSAISRSLRPAFKDPPEDEKAVQDALAIILRAIGVDTHREQERAAIGTTTFIPDFTVPSMDLAIEVKFSHAKHGEAKVQRELTEDVAAFGTTWKRLLAVIYDVGAIRYPETIKAEFEKHFGVQVIIVKH